jgi:hypothetical protein
LKRSINELYKQLLQIHKGGVITLQQTELKLNKIKQEKRIAIDHSRGKPNAFSNAIK